jgi:hypothetical protein
MITLEDAKSLAVAYEAFCHADTPGAKLVWTSRLLDLQRDTGVELQLDALLVQLIDIAHRQYAIERATEIVELEACLDA